MPYLKSTIKKQIDESGPTSGKELAYCFARDINYLIKARGLSADLLIEIEGALGLTGKDVFDRITKPYEQTKLALNGDVYDYGKPEKV